MGDKIQDCKMLPLLEGCRLSSNIFDPKYNAFYSKNNQKKNQKRGKEDYIQPNDWAAYGMNITGKFDFGDNTWLGNNNQEGEFAVAYYGINNLTICFSSAFNFIFFSNSIRRVGFLRTSN